MATFLAFIVGILATMLGTKFLISDEKSGETDLDKRAKEIESKLDEIEQEQKELEKNGVKKLSPQEELDYWKKQNE